MRAAEHIVYQSDNAVSASFEQILNRAVNEADGIISVTRADASTLADMRERYGKRMSRSFAFLRDIPAMNEAVGFIVRDIAGFSNDNKWSDYSEIPALFKNLDIIRMQEAVAAAILYTAEHFGSRGSGFVLNGTAFMDRVPVPEDTSGRGQVVTVCKQGKIEIKCVDVKPIPDRELWFEKVWNKYNEIRK